MSERVIVRCTKVPAAVWLRKLSLAPFLHGAAGVDDVMGIVGLP